MMNVCATALYCVVDILAYAPICVFYLYCTHLHIFRMCVFELSRVEC
jgi:hypothetical protein